MTVTETGQVAKFAPPFVPSWWNPEDYDEDYLENFFKADRSQVDRLLMIDLYGWVRGENVRKLAGKRSEWDQQNWIKTTDCGTVCCVAGRVALWDGRRPTSGDLDLPHHGRLQDVYWGGDVVVNGELWYAPDYAQDRLGLSSEQSEVLFEGENTFEDLRALMSWLIDVEDIDTLAL